MVALPPATLVAKRGMAMTLGSVRITTLVDVLRLRADVTPTRSAFVYLENGRDESAALSYSELDFAARRVAIRLQELGAEGERILLLYPHGLDLIVALFGCFYAGAVAVPALPASRPGHFRERLDAILVDAAPRFALTTAAYADALAGTSLRIEVTSDLHVAAPWNLLPAWTPPHVDPASTCMLQYTSGSTSDPKGVMLSHANIIHNEEMILERFEHTQETVVVSWLPLHHDMGLIGMIFQPLYVGNPCVLMPPVAFMQRPIRWLQAITRYRATTSGGPNFAYEMCVERIRELDCEGLDLSSLEIAYTGAEPIRAKTLQRFSERFKPFGFRPEAFYPCYGLAEGTLLVTGAKKRCLPRIREVDANALEFENLAVPATPGSETRTLVGCGTSPPTQSVRIVHPDTLETLAERKVGEIWVSGPSVADGYWNRIKETENTFRARTAGDSESPYLRTGDLGFLDHGELFVTGRIKDVLIVRGRNHYPQDIEATAEASHPALRPAGSAALLVARAGIERLVLLHELRREYVLGPDIAGIAAAVRQEVTRHHGLQVASLVLLKPGALPRTTSGKVRRQHCRAQLIAGELPAIAEDSHGEPIARAGPNSR